MKRVVVYKGEVLGLVDNVFGNGIVTFRYASMGKCVVVTSHLVNLSVIDSDILYDRFFEKTFGDITEQEIQDKADKNCLN